MLLCQHMPRVCGLKTGCEEPDWWECNRFSLPRLQEKRAEEEDRKKKGAQLTRTSGSIAEKDVARGGKGEREEGGRERGGREEKVSVGTSPLKSSRPKSCRASSRPPSKYTAPEESGGNRKSETDGDHQNRKYRPVRTRSGRLDGTVGSGLSGFGAFDVTFNTNFPIHVEKQQPQRTDRHQRRREEQGRGSSNTHTRRALGRGGDVGPDL